MHDQLQHWRRLGVSLSWETDGRMNMHTGELMDVIFMNEAERKMYEHEAAVTNSWIKSSKHDVTVVITLGEAGAEAYFRGDRFFCKGGDAFDAGFLDAPERCSRMSRTRSPKRSHRPWTDWAAESERLIVILLWRPSSHQRSLACGSRTRL
jgi:hypothetical protein